MRTAAPAGASDGSAAVDQTQAQRRAPRDRAAARGDERLVRAPSPRKMKEARRPSPAGGAIERDEQPRRAARHAEAPARATSARRQSRSI